MGVDEKRLEKYERIQDGARDFVKFSVDSMAQDQPDAGRVLFWLEVYERLSEASRMELRMALRERL